jgi:hypothetical protein
MFRLVSDNRPLNKKRREGVRLHFFSGISRESISSLQTERSRVPDHATARSVVATAARVVPQQADMSRIWGDAARTGVRWVVRPEGLEGCDRGCVCAELLPRTGLFQPALGSHCGA